MKLFISSLSGENITQPTDVIFGFYTDLHYGDIDNYGTSPIDKYPRTADQKLQKIVNFFNAQDRIDFMISAGDFIDNGQPHYQDPLVVKPEATDNLRYIQGIADQFNGPNYQTIGNHDMDRFTRAEFTSETNMSHEYYYFDKNGFRFIVLNANYYFDDENYPFEESSQYPTYTTENFVPANQRTWLTNTLASAPGKCIVFSHELLHENGGVYMIDNRVAVRAILEASGKVLACFNGHNHINVKEVINGIEYYSMMAACHNPYPTASSAIISIDSDNNLTIVGQDLQANYP